MTSGVPTSLPPGARVALLAPSAVTRAVAAADRDPERRWMLRLPRPVRRSFVAEVLDVGAGRLLQERGCCCNRTTCGSRTSSTRNCSSTNRTLRRCGCYARTAQSASPLSPRSSTTVIRAPRADRSARRSPSNRRGHWYRQGHFSGACCCPLADAKPGCRTRSTPIPVHAATPPPCRPRSATPWSAPERTAQWPNKPIPPL